MPVVSDVLELLLSPNDFAPEELPPDLRTTYCLLKAQHRIQNARWLLRWAQRLYQCAADDPRLGPYWTTLHAEERAALRWALACG